MTTCIQPGGWSSYLAEFHEEHAGITEEILAASTSGGRNPYAWLLEGVPGDADLLDLACGSAPLLRAGWHGSWTGVDRSSGEISLARGVAGNRVAMAEADHLPFADGQFSTVACSMALMLLQPLPACIAEVGRVLVPGGMLALLLPGGAGPLTARDRWRWSSLLAALRRARFSYPNSHLRRELVRFGTRGTLRILDEERHRFAYRVSSPSDAERFVDSLYLPGIPDARRRAARRRARAWVGTDIGIPLRRLLVCMR